MKHSDQAKELGFYSKNKGKPLEGFRRVADMICFLFFVFFRTVLAALWRTEWSEATMKAIDQ